MLTLYFNRKTGEAFIGEDRDEDDLRHLKSKGFERIVPNGLVRVRALAKGHLDVTSIPRPGDV